ncbi:hypothetical protein EDC04DRAFT_217917 [Pisolithus marmoratus]|nr:hypothetical protein EDC04DRAFT_217917 [Pisolithus marmoratus]
MTDFVQNLGHGLGSDRRQEKKRKRERKRSHLLTVLFVKRVTQYTFIGRSNAASMTSDRLIYNPKSSTNTWVSVLLDLGLEESTVEVNCVVRQSDRSMTQDMYDAPWHAFPSVTLQSMSILFLSYLDQNDSRRHPGTSLAKRKFHQLMQSPQGHMRYGSTSARRRTKWEDWAITQCKG